MKSKIIKALALGSALTLTSSTVAMAAIPNESVIIGSKAYSIDCLFNNAYTAQINADLAVSNGILYFNMNGGGWKDIITGHVVTNEQMTALPNVTYIDKDGKSSIYAKGNGDLVVAVSVESVSAVSGTAKVGVELTAGALTPVGVTARYQWQICATADGLYADIAGATTNKYTPVAGDATKFVKVVVTGTGSYSGIVTSIATGAIAKADGPALAGVTIDDTANTVSGLTSAMEISTNGTEWAAYNEIAPNLPDLTGTVALQVRVAATATHEAGAVATFNFTLVGTAPINLGTAGNYAILAKSGISSVPNSVITGNIGVSPAAATYITGFSLAEDAPNGFSTSTQITGKAYASDYASTTSSDLTTAVSNMEAAYTDASGRAVNYTELYTGDISGQTLTAGVYKWGTDVLINTDVTLNGGANDVFIFQVAKGITQANGTRMILSGGVQAKNIFWQAAETVSIGTTAHFEGIILGMKEITLGTNASINGRLLAQTAVTLDESTVVAPGTVAPTVTPTITGTPTAGNASVSGTAVAGSSVVLTLNDAITHTQISQTTVTADGSGNWTVSGLTLASGNTISVTAQATGLTVSATAPAIVQ